MNIEEIKLRKQQEKEEKERRRKEAWEHLKPFKDTFDIPALPVVNKEDWINFYVPILIRCGAIPKKDLIVGATYLGDCRNANEAIWNGEKFVYKRKKFNYVFDEEINHFEDDDGHDLFVPLKKL
jgi:hypothetical protein